MFSILDIPFLDTGLGTFLSKEAIDLHVNKHHKSYVDTANRLLSSDAGDEKYTIFRGKTLEEIIKKSEGPLFNNCSQHFNHSFFWLCLTNDKSKNEMSETVKNFLTERFESVDKFKEEFTNKAATLFGSGWVYLVMKKSDMTSYVIEIEQYQNADNPIRCNEYPILCIDTWEHAWYCDYENVKADYFKNYFDYIDWSFVESRLRLAKLI